MTKLMCRHFVEDEHDNYFNDMYSSEYAIDDLIDLFAGLDKAGKLSGKTTEYFDKAWRVILDTACYQDDGLPKFLYWGVVIKEEEERTYNKRVLSSFHIR